MSDFSTKLLNALSFSRSTVVLVAAVVVVVVAVVAVGVFIIESFCH